MHPCSHHGCQSKVNPDSTPAPSAGTAAPPTIKLVLRVPYPCCGRCCYHCQESSNRLDNGSRVTYLGTPKLHPPPVSKSPYFGFTPLPLLLNAPHHDTWSRGFGLCPQYLSYLSWATLAHFYCIVSGSELIYLFYIFICLYIAGIRAGS